MAVQTDSGSGSASWAHVQERSFLTTQSRPKRRKPEASDDVVVMTRDVVSSHPVSNKIVHGELLDAVTEMMVHARSPAARAAVMAELIHEMGATVEWLYGSGTGLDDSQADELTSFRRLSRAAQDHQRQMSPSRQTATSPTASAKLRLRAAFPARRVEPLRLHQPASDDFELNNDQQE